MYHFMWDGFENERSPISCNRQLKAQSGEIDIVNVCIILIGFRARILVKFQTLLVKQVARSLLILLTISEQLLARL